MDQFLNNISTKFNSKAFIGVLYVDYFECIDELLAEVDEKTVNEKWYVFWRPDLMPSQLSEAFIILGGPGNKRMPIFTENTKEYLIPYLRLNYKGFLK